MFSLSLIKLPPAAGGSSFGRATETHDVPSLLYSWAFPPPDHARRRQHPSQDFACIMPKAQKQSSHRTTTKQCCTTCRRRRVKCDPNPSGGPCFNCAGRNHECIYAPVSPEENEAYKRQRAMTREANAQGDTSDEDRATPSRGQNRRGAQPVSGIPSTPSTPSSRGRDAWGSCPARSIRAPVCINAQKYLSAPVLFLSYRYLSLLYSKGLYSFAQAPVIAMHI